MQMLGQQLKLNNINKNDSSKRQSKYESPTDIALFLKENCHLIHSKELMSLLKSLKVLLSCKPVSWVKEFGCKCGHVYLLNIIRDASHTKPFDKKLQELTSLCISCLSAFMNNSVCL